MHGETGMPNSPFWKKETRLELWWLSEGIYHFQNMGVVLRSFLLYPIQEMDNMGALKEALSRSDNMTHNMLGILDNFEKRLGRLEETIIPIYQETGNLQRRHESILTIWLPC